MSHPKGTCRVCTRSCQQRSDGLCGDCRYAVAAGQDPSSKFSDIALTGGRWLPDRCGVLRWRSAEHDQSVSA